MILSSLTCENENFRTLKFNKDLNIVVGKQETTNQKDTTNGVGKSLSLDIIHYMFNATIKDNKIKNFLKGYGKFTLKFSHNNSEYTIEKYFGDNSWIVNDKKYKSTEFPTALNDIFKTTDSGISFKQIFNCFARRSGYYENALTQQGRDLSDYNQKITNLFLLGIDINLQKDYYKLKDNLNKVKERKKYLIDNEEEIPKTKIKDIEDEIQNIQHKLDNFIIAENYNMLKNKADELTQNLNDKRNILHKLNQSLALKKTNFNSSENANVDSEEIKAIYEEAKIFFQDKIFTRLEEAQKFHNQLVQNRKNRLNGEISELNTKIINITKEIEKIGAERDLILKDLKANGALEERDSLKDIILKLEKEKNNLEFHTRIINETKKEETDINLKIKEKSIEANKYIQNNKNYLEELDSKFKNIVKKFYDNYGGTLEISQTKTKSAKNLFDIKVEIPKDNSLSIGMVKIFCYDILLYELNKTILGFLAHDGEIFSEMDVRQKARIFKIIIDKVKNDALQYFINISDSTFDEIMKYEDILSKEDKEFIESKIILRINEDEKTYLFGKKFD